MSIKFNQYGVGFKSTQQFDDLQLAHLDQIHYYWNNNQETSIDFKMSLQFRKNYFYTFNVDLDQINNHTLSLNYIHKLKINQNQENSQFAKFKINNDGDKQLILSHTYQGFYNNKFGVQGQFMLDKNGLSEIKGKLIMKDNQGVYKIATDLMSNQMDISLLKFYFKAQYDEFQFYYGHDLKNKINEISVGFKKYNQEIKIGSQFDNLNRFEPKIGLLWSYEFDFGNQNFFDQ